MEEEKLKIEKFDDENSILINDGLEKCGEEEYFQVPRLNINKSKTFQLSESDQLDGIVDNFIDSPCSTSQNMILNLNRKDDENNVIRVDLSKDDDIDDDEEHELLPSNIRLKVTNQNGTISPKKPVEDNENSANDEQLFAKAGRKINNLLVPRVKITDLNNIIPDLANQKVKIVNDKGLNLSSDASKTITVLNKDSSRFKLAILPNNNNEIINSNNNFLNFKINTSQIKLLNNNNNINTTNMINNKQPIVSNMLQDFEFGDSLKFVTNMKPTISSIDTENVQYQNLANIKKLSDDRAKSDKLISSIFENLAKSTFNEPTVAAVNTTISPIYKLGMESNYRLYQNQYSVNPLTMNKHQHNQERDRKNILGRRFLVAHDFSWKGNLFSNLDILAKNISNTIMYIESTIPVPLMHHLWPKYRDKWLKKLQNSKNIIDYAKCLLELEASMKPVLFVGAWKDGTGYLKLHRETLQEREEHKKKEETQFKRRPVMSLDETSYLPQQQIRVAHFTKGIKHQVFKQKGEEYRLTGAGGWYWFHKARRSHSKFEINKKINGSKLIMKNLLLNNLKDKKCIENILVEEDNIPDADQPWFNNSLHPYLQVFNIETIDISENLVTHELYPKETGRKSKFLDNLLEKRLQVYEEKKCANELLMKKLEDKLIDIEIEEFKKKDDKKQEETDAAVASLVVVDVIGEENNREVVGKVGQNEISRESMKEKIDINEKIRTILQKSRISTTGEYLIELNNELIRIPIIENSTCYKFKLTNIKKKKKTSDTQLPPYTNFMINNKTTIFAFPREITRLIARKGGFKIEIPGFKNDHHKQTIYWPYPCNRPLLKTCWCYKTFTASNLSSLALQIRYFWTCIRWDAINERPPINSSSYQGGIEPVLTEQLEDCIQTTELIKKRNTGLYNLRSEYLVRKKKIPYNKKSTKQSKTSLSSSFNTTPSISRTTSRRSGLRQLRQSIGQTYDSTGGDTDSNSGIVETFQVSESLENRNKNQLIEEWIAEERLHLWQIKSFYDRSKRLEIEEIRKKERCIKQQQYQAAAAALAYTPISKSTIPKSSPQTINQRLGLSSTINLMNNHYKINQTPSPQTIKVSTINNCQINKPIFNMTKVMPRTSPITSTTTTTPIQITNFRVLNSNTPNTTPTMNKTLRLPNGQTVTLIAKPQQSFNQLTPSTITVTSKPIIVAAASGNAVKTMTTLTTSLPTNSFSNLKINSPSGLVQKPSILLTNISQTAPTVQPVSLLSKTIINSSPPKVEILNKNEPVVEDEAVVVQQNDLLIALDPNSRSKRQRKLPAKLNDSYDLSYESSLNLNNNNNNNKPRPRPKSIQSILAQKEANEINNIIAIKANNILTAPTVSMKVVENVKQPVVSEKELLTKSDQLLEDIENRAKRKRLESLQKHCEELKEMIKYKKTVMELDVVESIRLDIDLDQYFDLKERLAPDEFEREINMIRLEKAKKEAEAVLLQKQQQELEKLEEQKQQQLNNEKKYENYNKNDENSNLITSKKEEIIINQNENEVLDDKNIKSKRKSKLRPEAISVIAPLSVSKENLQQIQLEQQQQHEVETVVDNKIVENDHDKKFIPKLKIQKQTKSIQQQQTIEPSIEFISQNEGNGRKRKISVTLNESLLNTSEGSNSDIKRHKLETSLTEHGKQHKNQKTYCICNSVYDKKRFYIQCDQCSNWYHGECVNITPQVAAELDQYKCVKCMEENKNKEKIIREEEEAILKQQQQQVETTKKRGRKKSIHVKIEEQEKEERQDLYCLCKKPYDERLFYIGCDKCQDWCHGSCVGILPLEAYTLDTYTCPKCLKKDGKEWILEKKISSKNYEIIKSIFYVLKVSCLLFFFIFVRKIKFLIF
jgi:hypothetical protein